MKILEELWFANINPQGPDAQKDPRMEQALYLVVKNEEALRSMLTDIQKEQYERLSDHNLVLVRLKNKGYMDETTYMAHLNEMNLKLGELRKLRRKILRSAGEDHAIQATREMIDYLENFTEHITEPPPEIFETVVEKIILASATQVKFQLTNGLELTETTERVK